MNSPTSKLLSITDELTLRHRCECPKNRKAKILANVDARLLNFKAERGCIKNETAAVRSFVQKTLIPLLSRLNQGCPD